MRTHLYDYMQLRPYQQEAISSLMSYWRKTPKGAPLIVAPTGSGKSLLLSEICRLALSVKPQFKIWVVTHRKELIEQNSKEIYGLLKTPIGIYSAGLGQKTVRNITCAGIQSIYKKEIEADLIIIDECHLIGPNDGSMYRTFLDRAQKKNSNVKLCGLTATPYRMDQGSLIGEVFTDVCYDIPVRDLIDDGFLCKLISKPRGNVDFSNVERSGFDYKQSALEETLDPLVQEHCNEILAQAADRSSILIFCSGVKHAKHVAETMQALGHSADYIHGEMLAMERDLKLERFKNGQTRILANCDILTTGFNFPDLRCVVLLRATRSTGLFVQIVGRGMRIAKDKSNCLVLDFGGNIERHGPIDCIEVRAKKKGDKVEIGKQPVKTCPSCGAVWNIRVLECSCGYQFSRESTVAPKATSSPIISEPEILDVDQMTVKVHNKDGSPPMIRIDYRCGMRLVSDFFCFEHGGYATQKARQKWARIGGKPVNRSEEALAQTILTPAQIKVLKDGKYYRVIAHLGQKETEDFSWEFS